jgi:preprotein translocase subunit SecE
MANEQIIVANEKPKSGLLEFIRETRREIAKVTWPTRKEVTLTTTLIVVFAIVAGLFFLMVDTALGRIVSFLLGMSS